MNAIDLVGIGLIVVGLATIAYVVADFVSYWIKAKARIRGLGR